MKIQFAMIWFDLYVTFDIIQTVIWDLYYHHYVSRNRNLSIIKSSSNMAQIWRVAAVSYPVEEGILAEISKTIPLKSFN